MQLQKVYPLVLVMLALLAAPASAQTCATQAECGQLIESMANGAVSIDGKNAIQEMSVTGCNFVRKYNQIADGCQGEKYEFEETDTGSFARLSSAAVMQNRNNAISLLFGPGAVERYRYCDECRVKERTISDAGMMLPAVDPMAAQRLSAAVSRMAVLCGAQNVNKADPVTTQETRVRN